MRLKRPQPSGRYEPRRRALPKEIDADDCLPGTDGVGSSDSHVMWDAAAPAPPHAQRWAGWPVEWSTPDWGGAVGLDAITKRVSTVFAAIDKQARVLSTMPPYRTRYGVVIDRPTWMRNPQPGVYTGWIEAFREVVYSYLGAGEVFVWATDRYRHTGAVKSWVMLNPSWVRVEQDGMVRRYFVNDEDYTGDVLHIRYATWPGEARGVGPLTAAGRSMFGAAALEQYQSDLASRGGIPWGVITVQGNLTAAQANDMRAEYVTARLGARAAPAVFSGGATLQPLNISPKDMALLELRQFDEARLAVLLGVPPFLLALPSGADSLTYQTVEGIYDYHWRSSLRPLAAELMEAIGSWALKNPDEAIELNRDEYVRPSLNQLAQAYATLHSIVETDPVTGKERRVVSVDEIRSAQRLVTDTSRAATVGGSLAVGT